MKKRILALLLCTAVVFSVCACGDGNGEGTENSQVENVEQPSVSKLAAYEDLSTVLTGTYVIDEAVLDEFFHYYLYSCGLGLEEVTDRDTVLDGDIVLADYTGYLNGEAFENGAATNQWIDVTNNCGVDTSTGYPTSTFIEGFTSGLVGAKLEEKTSSNVTFPEDYHSADLAGQPTTFEFTVHGIYRQVEQEMLNDSFVATNFETSYGLKTVAEFMTYIENELAYRYISSYLVSNSEFDISENYLNARLKQFEAYYQKKYCGGEDLETVVQTTFGTTLDAMRVEWLEMLEEQVKTELIMQEIVSDNNLTYDEAKHNTYISNVIAVNGETFPDADSIYTHMGLGNMDSGKAYMLNETAVKDYVAVKYGESKAQ